MIFTDRRRLIVRELETPEPVHLYSSKPLLLPDEEDHFIQEAASTAPIIIEIVQAASIVMAPASTELLILQGSGPQGAPGEQGPAGAAIASVSFSGDTMVIEYENGDITAVPFSLTEIDGGSF